MIYGYAGKILFIDLTDKTYREIKTEQYSEFLGGRGINIRLLHEFTNPGTKALSDENVLILGAGLLVGTLVPSASRLSVEFKNVITGGVGSGNAGGYFAAEMKFAGYDHIVISGRAKEKTYLYIEDDRVLFKDAKKIWDLDTWESDLAIKEIENDPLIRTMCIGKAGINKVRFSSIVIDGGRTVGYGGGGAVMGYKNLKTIGIRGSGCIKIAQVSDFHDEIIKYREKIDVSEAVKAHRNGGTLGPYLSKGARRPHGVRNMSDGYWSDEKIESISRKIFDKSYVKKRKGCFACPVYCSSIYDVKDLRSEGFHANSFRAFGSNLDITSAEAAFYCNALTNRYGLDGDQTSAVIGWAIECYQNGAIGGNETDGLELSWGDHETVIKLIHKIADREGFGDLLAEGVDGASKILGENTRQYSLLIKKNSLMEAAARVFKGWSLGIMTSSKGGGHLRGAPMQEVQSVSEEISKKLFGIDRMPEPTSYENKAKIVVWQEKYKSIIDSLGICILASNWVDVNLYQPDLLAKLFSQVTGKEMNGETLMQIGERINTMERVYNLAHAGFDRKDDMPPLKLTAQKISEGVYKGEHIDIKEWKKMLDEYYNYHHWNSRTGRPTKKNISELKLEFLRELLK